MSRTTMIGACAIAVLAAAWQAPARSTPNEAAPSAPVTSTLAATALDLGTLGGPYSDATRRRRRHRRRNSSNDSLGRRACVRLRPRSSHPHDDRPGHPRRHVLRRHRGGREHRRRLGADPGRSQSCVRLRPRRSHPDHDRPGHPRRHATQTPPRWTATSSSEPPPPQQTLPVMRSPTTSTQPARS